MNPSNPISLTMPSPEDLELIEYARGIVDANCGDKLYTVAAAVRDSTGRMHGGLNVYHFTGGPCAELVALGTARAGGGRELDVIVAVGNNGRGVLSPCGRDRQILLDYHPRIRVLIPTDEGVRSVPVADLLPAAYVAPSAVVVASAVSAAGPASAVSAASAESAASVESAASAASVESAAGGRPEQRVPAGQEIRFRRDHLATVRAGSKTTTIRRPGGIRLGPADLVFELEEPVVLPGSVTRITQARLGDLSVEDTHDGYASTAEILANLQSYYPGIGPADEVDVVTFEVTDLP